MTTNTQNKKVILTTFTVLADMARNVAGDKVIVKSLKNYHLKYTQREEPMRRSYPCSFAGELPQWCFGTSLASDVLHA